MHSMRQDPHHQPRLGRLPDPAVSRRCQSAGVHIVPRPDQPFLGTGEVAQGPTPAMIANAIGARMRQLPLSRERGAQGAGSLSRAD